MISDSAWIKYFEEYQGLLGEAFGFESTWTIDPSGEETGHCGSEIVVGLKWLNCIIQKHGIDDIGARFFGYLVAAHEKAHHLQAHRDLQAGNDHDALYLANVPSYEREADMLAGYQLFIYEMWTYGKAANELAVGLTGAAASLPMRSTRVGAEVAVGAKSECYRPYTGEHRVRAIVLGRSAAAFDLFDWDRKAPFRPMFQEYMRHARSQCFRSVATESGGI